MLGDVEPPRLAHEPNEPGIVHCLDGRGSPLAGRHELEPRVGLQRGPDGLGAADVLERPMGTDALELDLRVVQEVRGRVDDLHTSSNSSAM